MGTQALIPDASPRPMYCKTMFCLAIQCFFVCIFNAKRVTIAQPNPAQPGGEPCRQPIPPPAGQRRPAGPSLPPQRGHPPHQGEPASGAPPRSARPLPSIVDRFSCDCSGESASSVSLASRSRTTTRRGRSPRRAWTWSAGQKRRSEAPVTGLTPV